jgi:dipeptidyl aminopeptidase/acylaminoacyl peptidase
MRKFAALCILSILATAFYGYSQTRKENQVAGRGGDADRGAGKEPVKVTDLLKIKSVGEITLSRDGSQAAFVVTEIEKDTTVKTAAWDYKYVNHIYIVPADGSTPPRQLTGKESAASPAWSPDGRQLAFVRNVDGKPQIFLLRLDGGEPMQLTHFRYGAGNPKWSPQGKEILFSSRIGLKEMIDDSLLNPTHLLPPWPSEEPGIADNSLLWPSKGKAGPGGKAGSGGKADPGGEAGPEGKANPDGDRAQVRAWLAADVTDKKAKVVTKLNFQDEMEVNPDMVFNEFFVQSLQSGALPVAVTHGFYQYSSAAYTPDGRQLILTAHIDSMQNPDRGLESEIYISDGDGQHLRLLLGAKGMVYGNPVVSPSGKWLALTYGPVAYVGTPRLAIMPFNGSLEDKDTVAIDRATANYNWGGDDKWLYFTAHSNGGAPIYRVSPVSGKVEQLSDYNSGTGSLDLRSGHLLFSRTEVTDPSELYTADADGQHARAISAFNSAWVQTRALSLPEKHSFQNSLGQTVEYWVMKPIGFKPGQQYPLLLDIHGGPTAMWGPGESSMWHEFQFFCSKGYGVVYCNPRGSEGYGQAFIRGNIKDWGNGPTSDVLTALDKTVAEGWADTSRLLISGGSYAGYLVAWIVGHDHRFKAACAQRGVYDLATFFGEGNAWRLVPNYFGGYPWEPETKALLQHESPITYVRDISTPLIIFHGESDRRTGFVQGEMLYRSLKVLGRPVEYVRHPGATHELTRSGDNRQRIDQMLRTYEFFERYVGEMK